MNVYTNNVKWLIIGGGANIFLSSIQLLLQILLFSSEDFALYSLLMAYFTIYNFLLEGRFQDVISNKITIFNHNKKNRIRIGDYLIVEVFLKLIILFITLATLPFLLIYSNVDKSNLWILNFVAITIFLSKFGYGTSTGFLRITDDSKFFITLQNLEIVFRIFGSILLYFFGYLNVKLFLIYTGISLALFNMIQIIYFLNIARPLFVFKKFKKRLKYFRNLLTLNIATSATDLMTRDLDLIIISGHVLIQELAIYKASKSIAMILWRITDPFYLSLMPEINRLFKNRLYSEINTLLKDINKKMLTYTISASILFYLILHTILPFFKNGDYIETLFVLPIMMIGIIASSPLIYSHPLCVAIGKVSYQLLSSISGILAGLFFIYPLSYFFGIYGAATAWSLAFAITFFTLSILANKFYKNLISLQ
jgi:O-antigen/teichoic acid export membrane protein